MPSKYRSLITLRIENETKQLLKNLMKDVPDGVSRLLRKLIFFYLKKELNNEKINLEIKKEIKEYFNKKKRLKLKEKHKEKLFMYYLISNTLKTIYKLSSSHLINSGKVNMNIINNVIKGAVEIYDNYPEDIKNDLKNEMDNLTLLKDETKLLEKLKLMRLIATKKQIKYEEDK